MTALPAWKQSLLQKRRNPDEGENKRLQSLNGLPSWKRELILKKRNSADREIVTNGDNNSLSNNTDNDSVTTPRDMSAGKVTPRMASDFADGEAQSPRSPRGSILIHEDGGKVKGETEDEIAYQPGFVSKLLNKFSSISVKERKDSGFINLKKSPSVDNVPIHEKSEPNDFNSNVTNAKDALPSKNKFRSMDNLLSADEKRLEFSISPRKHSESFGNEDKIIIIEKQPVITEKERVIPVSNSKSQNLSPVTKPEDRRDVIENKKNVTTAEAEGDTENEIISVSKMKNLFERGNGPVKPKIKARAPKPPAPRNNVAVDTSKSDKTQTATTSGALGNSHSATTNHSSNVSSANSNITLVEKSSSTPVSHSAVPNHNSQNQQQGEPPKLLSYTKRKEPNERTTIQSSNSNSVGFKVDKPHQMSSDVDTNSQKFRNNSKSTSQVKNTVQNEKTRTKPVSVINRINEQVCSDAVYGSGDNSKISISEMELVGIRRAGKSWFFTASSSPAPMGSILVKMKLKRITTFLPKREKTAVNTQRKEHFNASTKPPSHIRRNERDNKLKQNTAAVAPPVGHPVAPSRKRHAPQPPKHTSVVRLSQEPGQSSTEPLKSSLSKGSGKTFRIQFNDDANSVHEYPSEKILIQHLPKEVDCSYADDDHMIHDDADDEDETDHDEPETKTNILTSAPAIDAAGNLSSYQSKYQQDYQFGMTMREDPPHIPVRPDEEKMEGEDDVAITYADDLETEAWSSAASSDMLF